jgi:DNA-binding NarL/FixJ family response regulator
VSLSEPLVDPGLGRPPQARDVVPLHLAVVVESPRSRDTIVELLAAAGLPVTAGAASLARIDELAQRSPDVLVVVGDLGGPAVLAAVRRVHRRTPSTRIVVVAPDGPTGAAARQSLNAGAEAFVPLRDAERALAAAVHAVVAGLVCAPRDVRRLVAKPSFSHREKQVLELVVAGLTNAEIAGSLFLSESTVKSHLVSAFAKLGVRSRKDAAALLLDPAEGLAATALPPEATLPASA